MNNRIDLRILGLKERSDNAMIGVNDWLGAESAELICDALPRSKCQRIVASTSGRAVGYAHCLPAIIGQGRRSPAHVWVRPGYRGEGIGRALWDSVIGVGKSAGANGLLTGIDIRDHVSIAIAGHYGLTECGKRIESKLTLCDLADDVIAASLARIPKRVEFTYFHGLIGVGRPWHAFYEAFASLALDMPDGTLGRQPTPEPALRAILREPWQILLGKLDGQIVAITSVCSRSLVMRDLNMFFTGVERSCRGCGLSTAICAEHARRLRGFGWKTVYDQFLSQNAAMGATSDRLGFVPTGCQMEFAYDF